MIASNPLPCQRHLFDMPTHVAYLNAASYGPIPRAIEAFGLKGVSGKAAPWTLDRLDTTVVAEQARTAGLIGAHSDDIAIVPATSYALAVAAANIPLVPGQRVVVLEGDFPSLVLPFRRLAQERHGIIDVVPRPADHDWTSAVLGRLEAPGAPVGVAALTPLHWTDGSLVDLNRIAPALRRQGASLVVDATQAAGVMPLDLETLQPDFLAFPTYKWLLGPYNAAFLYAAPRHHTDRPLELHGNAAPGGTLITSARRYDVGERDNPVSLPMALAALEMVLDWGVSAIAGTLSCTTAALVDAVINADGATAGITALPANLRAPHIVGLRFAGGLPRNAIARLAQAGVHVSDRDGVLRVSPHLYNDAQDITRLAVALRSLDRTT
jgi:selenocysteine lyase/cysteine desulfurase